MNKSYIKIFLFCIFCCSGSFFYATSNMDKITSDFMTLRVELTTYKDEKTAYNRLQEYDTLITEAKADWTYEEQLVYDSFYVSEEYNYLLNDKSKIKYIKDKLYTQAEKNEQFIQLHSSEELSSWIYTLTADCFSCYMYYSIVAGTVKYGTKLKKYYNTALEINPDSSTALTHLAQWYYWAPAIAGGSLNKSIELCERALKEKKSPAEEFYALFYLSQFLFDKNQKEKAAVYLNKALEIEKDSEFIKNYIKINNDGYSFFTYNKNKSKLEGYYSE